MNNNKRNGSSNTMMTQEGLGNHHLSYNGSVELGVINFSPEISKCTMPTEMKRNSALDINKYLLKTETGLMSERGALG